MVDNYDNQTSENDNVLKYIYKLKEHLDGITLLWQGLVKNRDGKLVRITEPIGPDDFIYSQITGLSAVLNPHSFVSKINDVNEKNNIIMDTYTAFLQSIEKEEYFNWDLFHMASESFYNTLHLFMNSLMDGFGAQFTIAAQTGITQRIPVNSKEVEKVPYMDVPGMFGFNKPAQPEQQPAQPNNFEERYD